jgi:hypothetical protein
VTRFYEGAVCVTIFICGGSNSVRAGGWVDHFTHDAINISIGASTSIMGAFRTIFTQDVKAGDTVIWEYALNDANQALGRGRLYTPDYLLRYCEALIRHCAARGARFIPLIFTPRPRERDEKPDVYRRKLTRLLRHYGLPFIDISREMRRKLEVSTLPDTLFFDDFHYASDSPPVRRAASRAARLYEADFAPVDPTIAPMLVSEGFELALFTDFQDAKAGTFSNKLLTLPVFEPDTLPLKLSARDRPGRIVGVFMISPSNGGVMELAIDNADGSRAETFDLSVSHNEPDFPKPVFKMFSLVNARAEPITFSVGQTLTLSVATGAGHPLNDMGFAPCPDEFSPRCTVSIAGILAELTG